MYHSSSCMLRQLMKNLRSLQHPNYGLYIDAKYQHSYLNYPNICIMPVWYKPAYLLMKINQLQSPKLLSLSQTSSVHTTASTSFKEGAGTKALALWEDVRHIKYSPVAALMYGFSALIPFGAAPLKIISDGCFLPYIATAQLCYGACILSFLGGVRWGLTLPDDSIIRPNWFNLGCSVTPPLIAWLGLLLPVNLGSLTVMGGLALSAYLDLTMYGYPKWYKALRFCLTFGAILSLWSVFMCSWILPVEKDRVAAKLKQE